MGRTIWMLRRAGVALTLSPLTLSALDHRPAALRHHGTLASEAGRKETAPRQNDRSSLGPIDCDRGIFLSFDRSANVTASWHAGAFLLVLNSGPMEQRKWAVAGTGPHTYWTVVIIRGPLNFGGHVRSNTLIDGPGHVIQDCCANTISFGAN